MRKDEWLLSVLIVLVLTAILIMVNLGQNLRSARETLIEVKTYNEHLKACIRKNNAEIDRLAIELSEKKYEIIKLESVMIKKHFNWIIENKEFLKGEYHE